MRLGTLPASLLPAQIFFLGYALYCIFRGLILSRCHNICRYTHGVWGEQGKCLITSSISSVPFSYFLGSLPVLLCFCLSLQIFPPNVLSVAGKNACLLLHHEWTVKRKMILPCRRFPYFIFPSVFWKKQKTKKNKIQIFFNRRKEKMFGDGPCSCGVMQWLWRGWAATVAWNQGDCQQRLGRQVGPQDLLRAATMLSKPNDFCQTFQRLWDGNLGKNISLTFLWPVVRKCGSICLDLLMNGKKFSEGW